MKAESAQQALRGLENGTTRATLRDLAERFCHPSRPKGQDVVAGGCSSWTPQHTHSGISTPSWQKLLAVHALGTEEFTGKPRART